MSHALELAKHLRVSQNHRGAMITRVVDCGGEAHLLTLEAAFWRALGELPRHSLVQIVTDAARVARRENASVEDALRVILIRHFRTKSGAEEGPASRSATPPRPRPRGPRRSVALLGRA